MLRCEYINEILNKFLNLSKNTRFLAVVGLSCSFLCIFLTYVKYTVLGLAVKIKLIDFFEGKLMILLILLNLMFIFKDYVKKYLPKLFENNIGRKIYDINDQRWILIPVALTVIFAFVVKGETKTEFLNIVYGLGFYLMWLGVISLVAFAFMYKNEKIKVALSTENKVNPNPTSESNVNIANEIRTEVTNEKVTQITKEDQTKLESELVQNTQEQNSSKYCVNCGSKCDSSAVKCQACGKDF